MKNPESIISSNLEFLDRQKIISANQHRLFTIDSIRDTFILVKDRELGETFPYRISELNVGDPIILKINRVIPGRVEMEDSVLNFMQNREVNHFKILRNEYPYLHLQKADSSFSFLCRTDQPVHKNKKKLDLRVNGFDLVRNVPLIEESNFLSSHSDPLLSTFDFEKKTRVKVKDQIHSEESIQLLISHEDKEFFVKGYTHQVNDNSIEELDLVLRLENGKLTLNQDRNSLVKSRYQKETLDSFKFLRCEYSPEKEKEVLFFEDDFGYVHSILAPDFLNQDQINEFEKGKFYNLWIKDIAENGFMVLFINHFRTNKNSFISPERLFTELGIPEYLEEEFPKIEAEFTTNPYFNNPLYKNPFDSLKKKENLWILSFGNCLDVFVDNLVFLGRPKEAIKILDLLIKIEHWLLGANDFLESFKTENRQNIIDKANEQIDLGKDKLKILEKINDGNPTAIIEELIRIAESADQPSIRDLQKIQFKFFALPTDQVSGTKDLLLLMVRLVQKVPNDIHFHFSLCKTLEKHIIHFRNQLNLTGRERFWEKDQLHQLKEKLFISIQLLALQINLDSNSSNQELQVHRSARICRFVALIYWDKDLGFEWINRSVKIITGEHILKIPIEKIESLPENLDWLSAIINRMKNLSSPRLYYKNGGVILKENQNWRVLGPAYQAQITFEPNYPTHQIGSYFDGLIEVHTLGKPKFSFNDSSSASQLGEHWKAYYQDNATDASFKFLKKGELITVEFQSILSTNPNLGFVKILDPGTFTQGGIHILQVSSVHIKGLNGILSPGDRFKARFIKSVDKKARISLKEDLVLLMKDKSEQITQTIFKVLMTNGTIAFGITKEGLYASYLFENAATEPQESHFHYFYPEADQSHKYEYVHGTLGQEVDTFFDEKKVLRKFIEKNLLISPKTELPHKEDSIVYNYVQEIIWSCETILNFPKISDSTKLAYIYLAKLLSSLLKNSKSFYLDEMAKYFTFLMKIKEEGILSAVEDIKPISEETIRNFPKVQKIQKIYDAVSFYPKAESSEGFLDKIKNSSSSDESDMIEFLMGMWILQKQNAINQRLIQRIFHSKLSILDTDTSSQLIEDELQISERQSITKVTPLNLGKENKNQEFKSSIIYDPESSSPNPEIQEFNILKTIAGFLNASGGDLYIGVNDQGDIIGLAKDYKFFGEKTNADSYERHLRKLIIRDFNKDISSQIEIQIIESEKVEYAKIQIPAYHVPVSLKNRFFQRQGNETREIVGQDLILFMERKFKSTNQPSD
ncbi:RNA-binding domain-containing protein [Algoriphagus hitonicola]|uniref:Putative DNA-binding domain-containing protein n=1 Tax=Algoriphagus hitonicola TaxID=435880 RepID=A0A1I2X2I8_9BACT|nr:RNA-binding domain-containing protein [Algoriphagus hitonicola]SFH06916.1 Putative DNA-binding domain-containing protein [Algoriphagus hitonicola]